jgi:hypothetical protein
MAFGSPAEFAAATGTGDDVPGVRLLHQIHLDREDPIVTDQAEAFSVKSGSSSKVTALFYG